MRRSPQPTTLVRIQHSLESLRFDWRASLRCAVTLSPRRGNALYRSRLSLGLLAAALLIADPAWATDEIFGDSSPLTTFIEFITGIFAYMLVIVGVVVTLGGLVFGNDMSGFARRAPLVVVAGAVLILSQTVVANLFGGAAGADLPPDIVKPYTGEETPPTTAPGARP